MADRILEMTTESSSDSAITRRHVGFLFNHDQIHQIAHSLPVAIALADAAPNLHISVATTNQTIDAEVSRLLGNDAHPKLKRIRLDINRLGSKLAKMILGKALPVGKVMMYRDNLEYFKSLDALIVTERTSLVLKRRYGLEKLKMLLVDHGAGDRAIGFGGSAAEFDTIFAAGLKIKERLVAEAGVDASKVVITGYPKFDVMNSTDARQLFLANDKPTVLYNPHLSPHLSSWFKHGRAILDWFVEHPEYNLIFAPHIMLFQRRAVFTIDKLRMAFPGSLDSKYERAPNIHIDLGSPASTDMTYTNAADIYLGDVSSQIYEFLCIPRPAVFVNSHRHSYMDDPNFAHWQAGDVIDNDEGIGAALESAAERHMSIFKAKQKLLFDYTFDLTNEPSSARVARAIVEIVSNG